MTKITRQLADDFERVASDAQTLTFPARASELQEACIAAIDTFLGHLEQMKAAAAERAHEVDANAILSMELSLAAVRSELNMWLRLKRDDSERAWDDLIDAQNSLKNAIAVRGQVGVQTATLENLQRKYEFIEHFVFPPQMFNSIGGTALLRECSICSRDYEDCNHVAGRAYMGNLCHRIVREFASLDHVALVGDPADKRCRVTHFSEGGRMRNKMTWRLEEPSCDQETAPQQVPSDRPRSKQ